MQDRDKRLHLRFARKELLGAYWQLAQALQKQQEQPEKPDANSHAIQFASDNIRKQSSNLNTNRSSSKKTENPTVFRLSKQTSRPLSQAQPRTSQLRIDCSI